MADAAPLGKRASAARNAMRAASGRVAEKISSVGARRPTGG